MQYFVTSDALASLETDCLVVAIYDGGELSASAAQLDEDTQGAVQRVIDSGDITGKAGQTLFIHHVSGIKSARILLVGFGKKGKTTENDFNSATTSMAQRTVV